MISEVGKKGINNDVVVSIHLGTPCSSSNNNSCRIMFDDIKTIIGMNDHVVIVIITTRLVILKQVANIKNGPYSRYVSILPLVELFGIFRLKTVIIVANKEKTIDKDTDTGIQRRFPFKSFT